MSNVHYLPGARIGANSRDEAVANVIDRQYAAIAQANIAKARAERRVQLMRRIMWRIPLHEWAEAQRRGNRAVHELLESYTPANAEWMLQEGLTPRCPPWATRNYRSAAARRHPLELAA